jgi:CheY-like chemotaxis protein
MSKEVTEKVFDPFFTTKGNKGSGLGLSVSYEIIRSHDGFIRVFSKENVGTTFEIELPISTELINVNDNLNDKQIDFNGSILIIDDRPQIRSVVADMIKSIANCKVKSCGCEDIEQEIHRRRYDIVICDFCMPDINGLQVASMVKDLYKDSYFCLMTGWIGSFKEDKVSKVDFILNKPISKEKIIELFTNYNRVKL